MPAVSYRLKFDPVKVELTALPLIKILSKPENVYNILLHG